MNNVVGKILIVLQLVFSLCFMCFAGAAFTFHEGWKKKADKFQTDLSSTQAQLRDEQDNRRDDTGKLTAQLTEMKNRAEAAEALLVTRKGQLDQAIGTQRNAEQERDKHLADLVVAQQEMLARVAETNEARSENKRLNDRVVDGIAVRRSLEDELLERQGQIDEGTERAEQMLAELARLRSLLRVNKIDPNDAIVGPVPAPVEKVTGKVLAAEKNQARTQENVKINIGSDDNIAKSMRLIVYRGRKFVCEIEVTEVFPSTAIGRVVESTRNSTIERDDNVTTRLD